MALNTFKCIYLTPLRFKGLTLKPLNFNAFWRQHFHFSYYHGGSPGTGGFATVSYTSTTGNVERCGIAFNWRGGDASPVAAAKLLIIPSTSSFIIPIHATVTLSPWWTSAPDVYVLHRRGAHTPRPTLHLRLHKTSVYHFLHKQAAKFYYQ